MKQEKRTLSRSEFLNLSYSEMLDFVSESDFEPSPAEPSPTEIKVSENWTNQIQGLQTFFDNIKPTAKPVQLNKCTVIFDVKKFANSHLQFVKSNNGNKCFSPYLHRLIKLKELLT